jgi:hypothetical protein
MFCVDVSTTAKALCVLLRIEQDGSSRPLGSGFFFMDQDVVATAKHIMEEVENARSPFWLRIRPVGTHEVYRPVECAYHAEQDLAFLHLDRRHRGVRPLIAGARTEAGFMYFAFDPNLGVPFAKRVPLFRVPEPRERRHSIEYSFEWDDLIHPGNSGGPLVATDGGVVAILSGVSSDVESADCEGRPFGPRESRARAVWIEPLFHTYVRWKTNRGSMLRDSVPFVIPR